MRLILRSSWWFVAWGALCSCGNDAELHNRDTGDDAPPHTDTDADTDTDTDTGSSDLPVWWALDGTWALNQGQAAQGEARFTVELRKADLTSLCATERAAASLTVVAPAPAPLWAAWDVTLADGAGCEHEVPQRFVVGIGPYDAQLDPAVAKNELDAAALFGLYLQPEDGPLVVFGVAGTDAQFEGTPAEAPPLPDGTYTLDGLHLLPL